MTAAWPGTLPPFPISQGYKETMPNTVLRTSMDNGPAKQRRRFTAAVRPFVLTFDLTAAQAATLDAFYVTTLQGGSLPFTWTHPRTGVAGSFRFTQPPEIVHIGGLTYSSNCQVELLP